MCKWKMVVCNLLKQRKDKLFMSDLIDSALGLTLQAIVLNYYVSSILCSKRANIFWRF
jgi:hypothetical protein